LMQKKGEYFRLYNLQFKDEGSDEKNDQLAKDSGMMTEIQAVTSL